MSTNVDALTAVLSQQYGSQSCGICQTKGAEVFWVSPNSRCAHAKCVKLIEKAEERLVSTLDALFTGPLRNMKTEARCMAIYSINNSLGNETILSFLEKKGIEKLTLVFDEVGIPVVTLYFHVNRRQEPKIKSKL